MRHVVKGKRHNQCTILVWALLKQKCGPQIEMDRLNWARQNQATLRAEMYQGVVDAVDAGDTAQNIGRRQVLPSSFIGDHAYLATEY